MNSKGLLATFFTFLFLVSLVNMTFNIKEHQTLFDSSKKWGLGMSRVSESFDQIEDGLLALMENVGKVSFSRDYNYARFSFSLPRTQQQALYEARLADFNRFVRRTTNTFIDFNLNGGKTELTALSLWELDTNFTQKLGAARDENAAFVIPRLYYLRYYIVEIRLTGQAFSSLSSNVTNCSGCSKAVGLKVVVKDENGAVADTFNDPDLSAAGYSEVLIETTSPGGNDLNVAVLPAGILSVRNDSGSVSDFNVVIDFGTGNQSLPVLRLSRPLIEVKDKVLGAEKK